MKASENEFQWAGEASSDGANAGRALRFLYHTAVGRMLLKPLTSRAVSKLAGRYMDSAASKALIARFVQKNGIDLKDYQPADYRSFNDFFTRKILPERRPFDMEAAHLCAPADGRLSVYRISAGMILEIKGSAYSLARLLGSAADAERFDRGLCLVFRLSVDDYHRYHFFDDGTRETSRFLPGRLHTVRPIALESAPVFTENCREVTLMHSDHFGVAAQIEVGAMLVGKIQNHPDAGRFVRGQEKGLFLYGGSTIILLLEQGAATLPDAFFEATACGKETRVRCGQRIGTAGKA